MANKSTEETKGAGKDVIQQSESVQKLYELVDLKGGGSLVEAFRRCQARKDSSEIDHILEFELKQYLYEGGQGKEIPISDLVSRRKESRQSQSTFATSNKKANPLCCYTNSNTVDSLTGSGYATNDRKGASSCSCRHICWNVKHLGAVGENVLHMCFLNATLVHYGLAKKIIRKYPVMVNDIYLSDEYYGESALHMAIVNEELAMVHFLCTHGADIHERAHGAFFCPEDQRDSRKDDLDQEAVTLDTETNYQGNTYFGEYPLSFAACLGEEDAVRYLIRRGACPHKQDINGNTVLHMMVIHNRMDMYDLLLEYDCCCDCRGNPVSNVKNEQGLTPLTLAAKLARKKMFHHILTREQEVFWEYGNVTCAAFPLKDLDTVKTKGDINEDSAVNIIIHHDSYLHLDLIDGIVHNLLIEKWKLACRFRFYQLLILYILYLLTCSVALYLRPIKDPNCYESINNSSAHNTSTQSASCDPCFLRESVYKSPGQMVRGVFEIMALIVAILYLLIIVREVIGQGPTTVFWGMVHNPLRALFSLSCVLVLVCLVTRFTCMVAAEDHLTVIALLTAWPYSLMFCRGFSLVGPFVEMIYRMIKRDFLIFFIIYMIFVIGFSQAMFLVMLGYDDSKVKENLFSRWFSSGLGLIVISMGEFEDLYAYVVESESPFRFLGLIMFFGFIVLGALLIVNMLIAMMGNTYNTVAETEKEWTRQWSRIVLSIERMLTPKQRMTMQRKYSQPIGNTNRDRALVMRMRKQNDKHESHRSQVSNDPKQQAQRKVSVVPPMKDDVWLNKNT